MGTRLCSMRAIGSNVDSKKYCIEDNYEDDDFDGPECDLFTSNCVRSDEKEQRKKELRKGEKKVLR